MSRDRIIQVYRGTTAQNNAFTGAAGEITMDTTRKELRVHDGSTAGGNLVGLKPGFVCPFAGTTAPDGWLICDGSAVSRTTYADLFAVIGTTYGTGDGNSTFNLPDYRDKTFRCNWSNAPENLGYATTGQLPNITGKVGCFAEQGTNGAFYSQSLNIGAGPYYANRNTAFMDASRSSSAYSRTDNIVVPASIVTWFCIKY